MEPTRGEVDALPGVTLLEFGTGWCAYCQATQPVLASVMETYQGTRHLRVEDGPGRALGRSYRVRLWPTLIVLKDGAEVARVVRPTDPKLIHEALSLADPAA
jgi:thioredoxin 1